MESVASGTKHRLEQLESAIKDPTILNFNYHQANYFNNPKEQPDLVFYSKLLNILSFGNLNDYEQLRDSIPQGDDLSEFLANSNFEYKLKSILVVKTIKSNYFKTWNKGSNKISYDVIARSICCDHPKILETDFLKELIANDILSGKLNSVDKSIIVTDISFNRDILLESNFEYQKYSERIAAMGTSEGHGVMDLNYIRDCLQDFRTKNISNAFNVLDIFDDIRSNEFDSPDGTPISASEFSEEPSVRKGSLDTIIL